MTTTINASKIKSALTIVHATERCSERSHGLPRAQAAANAAMVIGLSQEETDILLRAINVSPSELEAL